MFITTDKQSFCPKPVFVDSILFHHIGISTQTNTPFHIRTVPSMDLDIPEYSLTLFSLKLNSHSPYSFGRFKGFFHRKRRIRPIGCPAKVQGCLSLELLLFVSRGSCSAGIPPFHIHTQTHTGGFILLRLPPQEKAYFCFSRNPQNNF